MRHWLPFILGIAFGLNLGLLVAGNQIDECIDHFASALASLSECRQRCSSGWEVSR